MPKPSSANKQPAPPDPSRSKNVPAAGNRKSRKPAAAGAGLKKDSASKKVSRTSGCAGARSKNSSAVTEPVVTREISLTPSPGPRVSIGTALWQSGFDERAVAKELVYVVQCLANPNAADRSGTKKLLLDALKECSRQLDSTAAHRAGDAPVIVQLVHTVSRPLRPAPALLSANPSSTIEIAAPAVPANDSSVAVESTNSTTKPSTEPS